MKSNVLVATACALSLALASACVGAPMTSAHGSLFGQRAARMSPSDVPAGTRVFSNVPYGDDPRQRFDVYAPAQATNAPVIFMVHGGGWAIGNKNLQTVVKNKVDRWVPRGFILISIDYRMLPTPPREQAGDVARALAFAQQHAKDWGGEPSQFIVMGHSAGAHLVSLITADASIARQAGALPWLGTVSLDSAALDVVALMQRRHLPLYDHAFGDNASDWRAASPYQQLHGRTVPFLAVCSTRRNDSCPEAQKFVAKAASFGTPTKVLPEDLSHEEINASLGTASDYTDHVEAFMRGLSRTVALALSR
jgi:acetyl esterase/lipase